jgi:hypothetical protein
MLDASCAFNILQMSGSVQYCLPEQHSLDIAEDKCIRVLLQRALETLGFSQDDAVNIFKIVASVLKLGNIGFIPTNNIDGTEGCTISNDYGNLNNDLSFIFFYFNISG